MTDVRDLFQTLVDHPVAGPATIDELRGRARRHRRRTALARVALVLVVAAPTAGGVYLANRDELDRGQSIRVAGPGPQTIRYRSTAAGGYEASGEWSLTVERDGRAVALRSGIDPACGDDLIRPGDVVEAAIESQESTLRAGKGISCGSSG